MSLAIETACIHGNGLLEKDHPYRSITTPIFQVATFAHPGIGKSTGYDYSRVGNPTRYDLEQVVNTLEHGSGCLATTNGMAAIWLTLELFAPGDHIVASEDLYGGSVRLFDTVRDSHKLSVDYVNTSHPDLVRAAVNEHTKALYIETPSNPMMEVTDLSEMRKIADENNLLLIVDNTFLSPYYQNPIDLGADIVIHSGTKYLEGHNDTLAGFVISKDPGLHDKLSFLYKTTGPCLAPFDSFLVLRGIKTLSVRLEKQQENALKIARWLKEHPKVRDVYYVGLEDHPGYEVNKKQARGFGGMISFRTDSKETAERILSKIKIITFAESLGGVESLMTYPMLQTHGYLPAEVREKLGITDTLLRLSVGIENAEDLIDDLAQAFEEKTEYFEREKKMFTSGFRCSTYS
ncbi:MAG: PLP-dependent transferase [Lachnospiraceae bacterium]|nr:PLP-dependent transferase [Lachnospiraceae bacterium]